MSTEIQEYSKTEAALAELSAKYDGVIYDLSTREGLKAATSGRAELRDYRVNLEKTRKEIKAPALLRCQLIDSEAKRISTIISFLEEPIDEQIKAEERRKEEERTAAFRAEQERIAAEEKAKKEAEEAKLAAERAELEKQRAELAAQQKAAQDKIEAEQRAARMRIEEEERAARLAREEADRAARLEREAEEARLKAERDKLEEEQRQARLAAEAEQRKADEIARKEREAEEAKAREIARKKAESEDAYGLLKTFCSRYGGLPEFSAIAVVIEKFIEGKQ